MTKPDESRQLSPQQQAAVPLLLQGKTVTAVARDISVTRQTVSAWLNSDATFMAELNAERFSLWQGNKERLRALIPKAIDVLERGLDSADDKVSQAAARDILKVVDLSGLRPDTSTTVEDVQVDFDSKRAYRCQRRTANSFNSIVFR